MQIKYFIQLFTFSLVFLVFQNSLDAQRIAKNRNGEQIIIYPNGNWEKFDKRKSSHRKILKTYNSQIEGKSSDDISEKGLSETRGEKLIRLAEENVLEAEENLLLAEESLNDAKFNRMTLEDELEDLLNSDSPKAHEISFLENKIKGSKEVESRAKKNKKASKRALKDVKKKLAVVQPKQKGQKTNQPISTKGKKYTSSKRKNSKSKVAKKMSAKDKSTLTPETKKFAKYDINKDVMYNPPKPDCGLLFDGVDEFLGKKRKDVNLGTFFNYTDEGMRRFIGNKEYLICEGNFTQIEGGILLLNLHYSISTRDALRTFGGLSQGSLLTLKFINGGKVKLVNTKDVTGQFDPLTERHTFVAQYIVNSGQEKLLRKSEVDKVRVIWKTGFEDYEVYDVDFLKNQLKCLGRK